VEAVGKSDPAAALQALDRALQSGRTVERFCDHLIDHVRTLMVARVCGAETDLVDVSDASRGALSDHAAKFDAPTYVYMIALLEELRRNVKSSGAARALADAAIVRLAMSRQFTDIGTLLEKASGSGASNRVAGPSSATAADAKKNAATNHRPQPTVKSASSVAVSAPAATQLTATAKGGRDWERALRDPLVQKVREAVDGTLMDVRPAAVTKESTAQPAPMSADDAAEGQDLLPLE
jgi:DNA polymerase III gamma/tau subunit